MKTYNLNISLNSQTGNNENPSKIEGIKTLLNRANKAFSVLCCVLLAMMLLPISSFSQQEDCIDANTPPGSICGEWVNHTQTIYLTSFGPQYGNCPITIIYSTRICQVINGQCTTAVEQFRLASVDWNWDAIDCAAFTQYLMPGYPDDFTGVDPTNFDSFLGAMFEHLMDYHYLQYIAGLTPAQQLALKCNGVDPNCSLPACSSYESAYIAGKCKDLCIDFTNNHHIIVNIGECGAVPSACCILKAKYCPCFNSLNMLVSFVAHRTVTSDDGGCGGTGSLYGTCVYGPGNSVVYLPCQAFCPEIP